MHVAVLDPGDLEAVTPILAAAYPHDQVSIVAREKLFGANGPRAGTTLCAWVDNRPVGVITLAGRWIKLFAVDLDHRSQGVGTRLLELARSWVRNRGGGGRIRLMDQPGNYLSPGLDERDTAGCSWLERQGFKKRAVNVNMRVPLEDNPNVTEDRAAELAEMVRDNGYDIRRVSAPERELVMRVAAEAFAPAWAFELGRAMDQDPPAVFAAWASGSPVGFAAHDANNSGLGWFGPAGTLTEHTRRGLGQALLVHTLLDVRDKPEGGVIAWIGPRGFYERTVGAVDDRRFTVYEEGP